jgi:phage gpG-like protein
MSNGFSITLAKDDISKDIKSMLSKVKQPEKLLKAIGVGLVGLTKETFNNASLRPQPWVPKKDGSKATLKSREASLWRSIKVQSVTKANVKIGSDRPYAAIHHLGGKTRPMPARPYFPVWNDKLTQHGAKRTKEIIEAYMKLGG